ncbi:MAG: ATP-binding protein [Gammaproteobacteria bacterium]|nr:ATP-binding protein [Gammaproteobacteria bacterium]
MLVQFSVKNWRSIKDEQTLSMVQAKGNEWEADNTFEAGGALGTPRLLRSLVIYGANAAGKSNIINAMLFMKHYVVGSAQKQLGDAIGVQPFLLDASAETAPSEFEMIFLAEGVRYQYGFAATSQRVVEEWLIAYPKGRPQRWFSRMSVEGDTYHWEFGSYFTGLTGSKQLWQDSTRANALFLSTAIQLNNQQLKPIYHWFRTKLWVIGGDEGSYTASLCTKAEYRTQILTYLKAADLDIDEVQVETRKVAGDLPDHLLEVLNSTLLEKLKAQEVLDIKTVHRFAQGRSIHFSMDDESDGTQRFFALAGPWIESLEKGSIVLVD